MAAYDGHFYGFPQAFSGNSILELRADGSLAPLTSVDSGNSTLGIHNNGWYSRMDGTVTITNHYHKRGWRTESNTYVEWESTDRETPYPGGGTVDPVVGTVVYQWVTYSNGQLPA